jgi:hypothetical protein
MWGEIITYIVGHAASRSIFKESPEAKAARIAEEKRKKREQFWKELLMVMVLLLFLSALGYGFYLYLKANNLLPS